MMAEVATIANEGFWGMVTGAGRAGRGVVSWRLLSPPESTGAAQRGRLLLSWRWAQGQQPERTVMSESSRRHCTPEERFRLVLESLQSDQKVAELCRSEGLSPRRCTSGASS